MDRTSVKNIVIVSDFGDDPDDGAAAAEYLLKPYDHIHIVVTTGDTCERIKIFHHLFTEWFENKTLIDMGNGIYKNIHGTEIVLIAGIDTARKINVGVPDNSGGCHIFWTHYDSIMFDDNTFDMLVLAPLDGILLPETFKPCNTVVVGSNPKSQLPKSINTGSGMKGSQLNILEYNFEILNKNSENITYLTSEHIRKVAPKFNVNNIMTYPLQLQEQCWDVISKFLLGPRPTHLPPGVLKRIGYANATTLKDICNAIGLGVVTTQFSRKEAQLYSDVYIGKVATDIDVENLTFISDAIYILTGYRLGDAMTTSISEHGKDNFINRMKNDERIQGTPNYDGYGYRFLINRCCEMVEKDEFNQVM